MGETESSMSEMVKMMRFYFFKKKRAYDVSLGLVGSEMSIRDSHSSHTADPLNERPPKQDSVGKTFNAIGQIWKSVCIPNDGCTRRGYAGHGFKKCICDVGDSTGKIEWQCACHSRDDPGKCNNRKPVSIGQRSAMPRHDPNR